MVKKKKERWLDQLKCNYTWHNLEEVYKSHS